MEKSFLTPRNSFSCAALSDMMEERTVATRIGEVSSEVPSQCVTPCGGPNITAPRSSWICKGAGYCPFFATAQYAGGWQGMASSNCHSNTDRNTDTGRHTDRRRHTQTRTHVRTRVRTPTPTHKQRQKISMNNQDKYNLEWRTSTYKASRQYWNYHHK